MDALELLLIGNPATIGESQGYGRVKVNWRAIPRLNNAIDQKGVGGSRGADKPHDPTI